MSPLRGYFEVESRKSKVESFFKLGYSGRDYYSCNSLLGS